MALIEGNEDGNNLPGTAGDDVLKGYGGQDTLTGGLGADVLDGGEGFDTASYQDSNESVVVFLNGTGALGTAEGDIYIGIENIEGSSFYDILVGDDGDNVISGGGGSVDELSGGAGDDKLRGNGNLFGGADDDNLGAGLGRSSLFGGSGDDFLVGGEGEDLMDGGADYDTLSYESAKAGVSLNLDSGGFGGIANGDTYAGIEEVAGSRFEDFIGGNGSLNVLEGYEGDDTLKGYGGDDELEGSFGDDRLFGGSDDDLLIGGVGADVLDGGAGVDTVDYFDAFKGVTVNLQTGKGFGSDAQGDTYSSIEIVVGSEFGDKLIGDDLKNLLNGDVGGDQLYGNGGDDVLTGGQGSDQMFGGAGNDTYNVSDSTDVISEIGGSGIDTVNSSVTINLFNTAAVKGDIENVTLTGSAGVNADGNALNNLLIGNSGANGLFGNSGADTMRGMGGNDLYFVDNAGDVVDESIAGSSGIDQVRSAISFSLSGTQVRGTIENLVLTGFGNINGAGNAATNTIIGNNGKNDLMGLGGNDILTGGVGADTFVFNAALNAATNVDTITDFNVAADSIRLENAFMQALGNGPLGASAFHIGASAADASDRIVYNSGTGALSYDADGTGAGAAIKFAEMDDGLSLTFADFLIV